MVYLQDQTPNLFHYNQSTFQSFYFFEKVLLDSNFIDSNDWVGIFNCKEWNVDSTSCVKLGKCVGARKYDRSRCGGGICDLPAMGESLKGDKETEGYLKSGEYPVFLIYDSSRNVYYQTQVEGDVKNQKDICRNGYPFCYGWENQSFPFSFSLTAKDIYMDCMGKLGGDKIFDSCKVCGGAGPQYECIETGKFYCNEAIFQSECFN